MLTEWLILQGIIERGLLFSLCVMSMYLTSRIIKFDDLSLEGSFGLGGPSWHCYFLKILRGGSHFRALWCAELSQDLQRDYYIQNYN